MRAFWVTWLALSCCLGCSSGELETYEAGGIFTFADGKPLSGGMVTFRCMDNAKNLTAQGDIVEDGTFTLTTFEPGDGALLGRHQVLVMAPRVRPPRGGKWEAPAPTAKIDRRFSSFDTSGLEFTITDDPDQNQFKITVTAPDE